MEQREPRLEKISDHRVRVTVENVSEVGMHSLLENRDHLLKQKDHVLSQKVKFEKQIEGELNKIDDGIEKINELIKKAEELGVTPEPPKKKGKGKK
jgi:hypothetical protein